MTRQDIIDFCMTFPATYEDYLFDDITDPGKWYNTPFLMLIYIDDVYHGNGYGG